MCKYTIPFLISEVKSIEIHCVNLTQAFKWKYATIWLMDLMGVPSWFKSCALDWPSSVSTQLTSPIQSAAHSAILSHLTPTHVSDTGFHLVPPEQNKNAKQPPQSHSQILTANYLFLTSKFLGPIHHFSLISSETTLSVRTLIMCWL